jgi:HAD superfamily hydrolase (TIGR01509 family)
MIGAILFDVDGTLVDSNDLHAAAWQEAFRHFGIVLPYDRIRGQVGKGGDNLIPSLLPPEIVDRLQEDIEDFRSDLFAQDYLHRVRPIPGVVELFRKLHADDIGIVLATSAGKEELDFHINRLGCRDLLLAATSRDDVERSKPCPDIFTAALAKVAPFGPDEAIVVGDTPYDAAAATKAGLRAVAVRSGGFPDAALIEAGAIAVYDGPKELAELYPSWLPD